VIFQKRLLPSFCVFFSWKKTKDMMDELAVGHKIGSGAYACAHQGQLQGKAVAVKVMQANEDTEEVFERERLMLSRCRHEGVVELITAFRREQQFYLVLELYAHRLEPEMLAASERRLRARELVEAVAAIHAQGVLHLDLKPSNLLLSPQRRLVVADFGLAHTEAEARETTRTFVSLGYRAPELLLHGNEFVGPATDMWSVGCILAEIEMAKTGLFEFRSEAGSLGSMLRVLPTPDPATLQLALKRCHLPAYTPPDRPLAQVSAPLRDLLTGLLHWDPSRRPSAAATLAHAYFTKG
jgi:serine/threonine protein kinase